MHQLPRPKVLEGFHPWKSPHPPETKLPWVFEGNIDIPKKPHQQTTRSSSDSLGLASCTVHDLSHLHRWQGYQKEGSDGTQAPRNTPARCPLQHSHLPGCPEKSPGGSAFNLSSSEIGRCPLTAFVQSCTNVRNLVKRMVSSILVNKWK